MLHRVPVYGVRIPAFIRNHRFGVSKWRPKWRIQFSLIEVKFVLTEILANVHKTWLPGADDGLIQERTLSHEPRCSKQLRITPEVRAMFAI